MTSPSLNIKNLSFATRINGQEELLINLKNMLDEEMNNLYKEQHPKQYIPDADKPNQDDEIPF